MAESDDDDTGVVEHLLDTMGINSTEWGRTQDDSCDHCGTDQGSMTTSNSGGWTLCRACMNDPEILEEYVDG